MSFIRADLYPLVIGDGVEVRVEDQVFMGFINHIIPAWEVPPGNLVFNEQTPPADFFEPAPVDRVILRDECKAVVLPIIPIMAIQKIKVL